MRTRIAGGLFVSHLRSETDLKSHNKKEENQNDFLLFYCITECSFKRLKNEG